MKILSYFFSQTIETSHSRHNKTITVVERFGKKELYANDIQQSGFYTARLWILGLKELFSHPPKNTKKILVLGIGGGTLFPVLERIFPAAHITAVDIDSEIIRLYRKYFHSVSQARLVCADAREYVKDQARKNRSFDIIIVDLYIGNDVPQFVTSGTFLASIKRVMAPGGVVVWNYFSSGNHFRNSQILLDKLLGIYHSVMSQDILRNTFFYCR
jgi:spermidine synthase